MSPGGLTLGRWLMAEAFERRGNLDSAEAYFGLAASTAGRMDPVEQTVVGLATSFAHRRLALLYERAGKRQLARHQWEMFVRAFTDPDPEFKPMLDEAKRALSSR